MQLTADQQRAANEFAIFMASHDAEFAISGPAGVGKTALLRYLRDNRDHITVCELLGKRPITKWAFTATTNKAAEVLGDALGSEASTIHQLLGLKVRNDYKTGQTLLTKTNHHDIVSDTVIVVDEASMVDQQLLKMLRDSTLNCKIVFVGDHCQMAPVKEPISPVFSQITPVQISQVVRSQHTPQITALCMALRNTVETGEFFPLGHFAAPGVIDFLDWAEAEREIRANFIDYKADARILAYTNRKVMALNQWIRSECGLGDRLMAGETVVTCNAAEILDAPNRQRTRIEQEITILRVDDDTTETIVSRDKSWFEVPCYNVDTSVGLLRIPIDPQGLTALGKQFVKAQDWPANFKTKEDFADLRPRDACTVYKAQGSTYETVFVDLADIGTCTNAAQAARMLYVACSRPTTRICFFGQLPPRLRGA